MQLCMYYMHVFYVRFFMYILYVCITIGLLMLKRQDRISHVFFKNGWKPSQKTRFDALIIFHVE